MGKSSRKKIKVLGEAGAGEDRARPSKCLDTGKESETSPTRIKHLKAYWQR